MPPHQKSKIEKIGKYFRPIFWAYLMTFSFLGLIKFIETLFLPEWYEVRQTTGIFLTIFLILFLVTFLVISIYKVTHPYISKNDHDENDVDWGLASFILGPLTIHCLLVFLWDIDIIGFVLILFQSF